MSVEAPDVVPGVCVPRSCSQSRLPVGVIMLTLNEEVHLPQALDDVLSWASEVVIVDSLSTDRTVDIALERGVTVLQRPFTNFGDQWNWALRHAPISSPWTMKLDPDERVTPGLREGIATLLKGDPEHTGYSFRRRLWFMGRPLRQSGWVCRLWRTGRCRFTDVRVNEHPVVDGTDGEVDGVLEHFDSPHLHHWFEKQNVYSTMRATEAALGEGYAARPRLFGSRLQRRMFLKRCFFRMPFRYMFFRLYMLLFRGAFFDGSAGRDWVEMRASVYRWAELKVREMQRTGIVPTVLQLKGGDYDDRVQGTVLQRRVMGEPDFQPSLGPARHPFADRKGQRKNLRVGVNAVSVDVGGGQVVLLGYLRAWFAMGSPIEPVVYVSNPHTEDLVRGVWPGIEVVMLPNAMTSKRRFWLQQFTLGPRMVRDGIDVVWTTNTFIGRCRLPQIVHHQNLKRFVHFSVLGQLVRGRFGVAFKDYTSRRGLRCAAFNTYISHVLRSAAEAIQPASALRNEVVHNALDQPLLDAARAGSEQGYDSAHIAAIQSSAVQKDTPTLLRAFAAICDANPSVPWRLTIASKGEWDELKAFACELGILDRVEFMGHVEQDGIDAMLRSALCLVFTSTLEGFGIPPLEAMARRCPGVVCDSTAMPEVVGDAMPRVAPGDHEAFAREVLKMHADPAWRTELVDRGVERAQLFSWDNSATKMLDLLERAARSPIRGCSVTRSCRIV